MNEQPIDASLELVQPNALDTLERANIDVQISTAHRYPRSLEQFKKRSMEMATLDFETSQSCIYCRPVGKEKNAAGEWVNKFAEGASIRMAEIVAASYGNIRVGARIIEQTDRYVVCEGYAHDLESNYAAKSEVKEATVKSDKITPYDERMRALIAKATLSKAFRDAVFKVVPKALCKSVIDAAKKVVIGDSTTLEDRRKKAAEWVKSKNIDETRVFAALGVKGWAEVGLEQLSTLTGLRTAINDGEVTIEEAFPPVAKAPENLPTEAPALFPAGEGKPAAKKKAAAPVPDSKVTELRKLIAEAKLTEAAIVKALHDSGIDETLLTLDDIHKVNPNAISHAVANFAEIKPK